jgi:arginyl-tRNA synthetase
MNRAHTHLQTALSAAVRSLGIDPPNIILEKPRDAAHGDIATNAAMTCAKELRKPPRIIAEEILKTIRLDRAIIEKEDIAGPGFINFTFAISYLHSIATQALSTGDAIGNSRELADKKVLLEFVSANPSGPLNIVSARAAAVGDTLARLFRARGAQCECEYYVNDAGNQVRLLGESVRARYETTLGYPQEIPEGGYHGEYIADFAAEIADQEGNRFHILDPTTAAAELGTLAIRHFIEMHHQTLDAFRAHYDNWFHESSLRSAKAEWSALDRLKEKQAVYVKDGATWLETSRFGDAKDWIIVTSDGRPTYFLPDIAYHFNKYQRGYDHIINILGPDHHSFTAKMKAAMQALDCDPDKLEVMLLQHVTLLRDGEPVKMSKRAGRIIEMDELIEEAGVDAARYFFLLRRTTTPLDFDIELAKQHSDDNPVYYVQYAHARIESIFRKGGVPCPDAQTDLRLLRAPEELDLLRRIRELYDVIADCTHGRDPHGMTVWLRDVATQFHKFYHNCRVLTEPAELQQARLALCRATQIALQKGLMLCGVSAPKEM